MGRREGHGRLQRPRTVTVLVAVIAGAILIGIGFALFGHPYALVGSLVVTMLLLPELLERTTFARPISVRPPTKAGPAWAYLLFILGGVILSALFPIGWIENIDVPSLSRYSDQSYPLHRSPVFIVFLFAASCFGVWMSVAMTWAWFRDLRRARRERRALRQKS